MIAWDDYLKKLVSEPDEMDGITLSFNGGDTNISVLPCASAQTHRVSSENRRSRDTPSKKREAVFARNRAHSDIAR